MSNPDPATRAAIKLAAMSEGAWQSHLKTKPRADLEENAATLEAAAAKVRSAAPGIRSEVSLMVVGQFGDLFEKRAAQCREQLRSTEPPE